MAASPAREPVAASSARPDEQIALFFERHADDVLRFCRAKLRSPADAEDVAQQVFVRAYGALLRGERVRLPRHWLLRIARNECRRHYERARRVDLVEFDEAIDVAPETDDARWSPEEIRRALDELVPAQRQAIVLRELEGRTYGEIARELRLTVSAVETLLFRARRSLREQLDGAIACGAAERALSLELDGRLPAAERPQLRAHLRACPDCRRLAQSSRARRGALRTLLPLPLSTSFGEGGAVAVGGAAAGTGLALKAAAILTAGAISAGVGLESATATKQVLEREGATSNVARQQTRAAGAAGGSGSHAATASPSGSPTGGGTAPAGTAAAGAAATPTTATSAAGAPTSALTLTAAASAPSTGTGAETSPVAGVAKAAASTLTSQLPAVSVPSVTTPTVTTPTVTTPSVTTPSATVPSVETAVVTTPSVTLPSVTAPTVTTPTVTTPTVTTPELPVAPPLLGG
jgi:RNA polymerase sigma factor (sigma-70 family)